MALYQRLELNEFRLSDQLLHPYSEFSTNTNSVQPTLRTDNLSEAQPPEQEIQNFCTFPRYIAQNINGHTQNVTLIHF